MKKIIYTPAIALFIGALLLISSCSKREAVHGGSPGPAASNIEDQSIQSKIRTIVSRLPHVKATNSSNMRKADANTTQSNGWSFSDPSNTVTVYSTPDGVSYSVASNTFTVSGSGGGGAGGGTVVAGSSSLDMNATYCFSLGGEAFGLDAFGTGAPKTGISGVIGLSGDFEKLANATDGNEIAEAFNGLAFYLVYDQLPSGNYEVIDWTDPDVNLNDTTPGGELDRMAFAFIVDFKNGKFYLSKSGTITVSGGSMSFNGTYFEVGGFKVDENSGDFNLDEITVREVPGFGAMMCN